MLMLTLTPVTISKPPRKASNKQGRDPLVLLCEHESCHPPARQYPAKSAHAGHGLALLAADHDWAELADAALRDPAHRCRLRRQGNRRLGPVGLAPDDD